MCGHIDLIDATVEQSLECIQRGQLSKQNTDSTGTNINDQEVKPYKMEKLL